MKKFVVYIFVMMGLLYLPGCSIKYDEVANTSVQSDFATFHKEVTINSGNLSYKELELMYSRENPGTLFISLYKDTIGNNMGFTLHEKAGKYHLIFGIQPVAGDAGGHAILERGYFGMKSQNDVIMASVDRLPLFFFVWKPTVISGHEIEKGEVEFAILKTVNDKQKVDRFLHLARQYFNLQNMKILIHEINRRYDMHYNLNNYLNRNEKEQLKQEKLKKKLQKRMGKYSTLIGMPCNSWDGNIDENGYPDGDGTLSCFETVGSTFLMADKMYVKIGTTMHHGNFNSGNVTIFEGLTHYFTNTQFNSIRQLKNFISTAENQYYAKKNPTGSQGTALDCNRMNRICTRHCEGKSDASGFFSNSAKQSCRMGCQYAYDSCGHVKKSTALSRFCSAMCEGLNKTNGATIFGTSDFNTCTDNCYFKYRD